VKTEIPKPNTLVYRTEKGSMYLDKIARNVIKIDQHTYGTKSNTENMLRQMGHTDSITL
jgi:hypothetical protein